MITISADCPKWGSIFVAVSYLHQAGGHVRSALRQYGRINMLRKLYEL